MTYDLSAIPDVLSAIRSGMALEKCRRCGCMAQALDGAEEFAWQARDADLLRTVHTYKQNRLPVSYDCLGCGKCWGAEALNALARTGWQMEIVCSTGGSYAHDWPPVAGEYLLGQASASVAVCTLSDSDLAEDVMEIGGASVAIAGRCETENIGVEKIILNVIANQKIRWLILCGDDTEGHEPGDALLNLSEHGVDPQMRIQGALSHRPVLKNLSLKDVARFRQQVIVVNRIGCDDAVQIAELAAELASQTLPPLPAYFVDASTKEKTSARSPERLHLDPGGFFVIIPDRRSGTIVCEHYLNDGTLNEIVEGESAALIAATAVEMGLVTQLDHAAYLGRELTRAEEAVKTGQDYVQDRALGEPDEPVSVESAEAACG